jgi:hypothetical protein
MRTIAFANLLLFAVVFSIGILNGLDLKKWTSWLLVLYGFLSGLLVGFLREGGSLNLPGGILFACVVLYGGTMIRWQRQRYSKDAAESWLSRYGQEERFSALARLIKKLLKK